jgi:TonB family protein
VPSPASNRSLDGGSEASSAPSARAAAEIIAISTRDDFLLEIGEALSGGQTSVRPVDSVETALDTLGTNRKVTQLIAIDARDVTNVRAAVEQVIGQAAHTVVLVFASADAEKQTASSLKGTNIFAVLSLPLDKRKAAAVIDGAVADAISRRPAQAPQRPAAGGDLRFDRNSSITVETSAGDAGYASPSDSGSGGSKTMILVGGGAAVVVAAAAAWFFLREPSAPVPGASPAKEASVSIDVARENAAADDVVAEPAPVVDMPLIDGTVDELLEKARSAMRERRYTEPNGDNALLYYRSAAKADPDNGEAADGLRRVASVLSTRFDEALAASEFDEAALALAHLKAATPEDERIASLEAKLATAHITRMLADGNLDRAAALVKGAQQSGAVPEQQITRWRSEITRRQDEARQRRLVDLIQDRIRDGRLNEGDDSAKAYAEQLRAMGSGAASAYQRVNRELSAAYMRKAREAAVANRSSEADRWLSEARAIGVSSSELNSFQREVAAAKQRAAAAEADRLVNLARDRLKDGRLLEPANDSAAFYLTALQSADADNAFLASGGRELATKLLDRASTAGREGKTAQMEADLAQARKWGADTKDIQAIQQAAAARRATPTRAAAAGSAPGAGASGSAAPPEDKVIRLKRTRSQEPEYPERALAQRISGSVTVEFLVGTKGETLDVRVVASEPAGIFDRSAVNAVKRWRYEPYTVNGVPQEVTQRAIIRFSPDQ